MSEEKVLTKEIAEQWLANTYSFSLSEFTAIDDGVAELLGNWDDRHGTPSGRCNESLGKSC